MTWKDEALWNYHKQKGKTLCKRPLGYVIFDIRPLSPVLQRYACNDVEDMPAAFAEISEVLCEQDGWTERVKESQKLAMQRTLSDYEPHGAYNFISLKALRLMPMFRK